MLLIAYEKIGGVHLKKHKLVLKIVFVDVLKFRIVFSFLGPCRTFMLVKTVFEYLLSFQRYLRSKF